MVLDQMRAGRPVAGLARDLEMCQSTLHHWKRQDRVDRGLISGVSTVEGAELKAARRRIRELEAELAAVKRVSELFDDERVMRPKDLYPIVAALGAEGHGLKASWGLLGVSSAGFFHWRGRPLAPRAVRRASLAEVVIEIWQQSRRCYRWRRIRAELAHSWGHHASRKLLRSIMREHDICGLPRHKSRRRDELRPAGGKDLVNRKFSRDGLDRLWMTDITEHPTRRFRATPPPTTTRRLTPTNRA